MAAPPYVPLWTKSHHSFLEGASSPEELIDTAGDLGLPAIALTDRNGVYGVVRAHERARSRDDVRAIFGVELRIDDEEGSHGARELQRGKTSARSAAVGGRCGGTRGGTRSGSRGATPSNAGSAAGGTRSAIDGQRVGEGTTSGSSRSAPRRVGGAPAGRVVLLPVDRRGWANLCRLTTRAHTRGAKGDAWATCEELADHAEHLIALSADLSLLPVIRGAFDRRGHAFVARHRISGEREREQQLRAAAWRLGLGLVGGQEVLYHHPDRRRLQDAVNCIRHHTTLRHAGSILKPNHDFAIRSARAMRALFRDDPALLHATLDIAAECTFRLEDLRYRYPEESLPDGETEQSWLRVRTLRGAENRYPAGVPEGVRTQLERELGVIEQLEYGGYFLTMVEIVDFCRAEGILCQGRGSAANSAVCFCLGITAIDPVRMDLLFERFLSVERAEPPDIDLDIEHERREEVIQHVYERYGRRRAAMVANCIRYRGKSAVREMGKALGIPETDLDAVSKLMPHFGGEIQDAEELAKGAGLDPHAPSTFHLLKLASELIDAPRHQSIHPGGFLLGDVPVDELVPVEPATMEGRTVIQWDKYDVENLALFKVDLLGLGALTCIRKSFELLREHEGLDLGIATVPPDDKATYDMVSRGDTVGVFQIESRAQMAMLPRLKPRTFYDLVIEVAIVRPGPIQGDMVHPYLRRRDGLETVEYPHPKLERVLQKTLGVPIFQEQVMKVAVAVADYTPGEADQLRRDMAAWRSSGKIEQHHERMTGAMVNNGIPLDFAERVFSQIRGFGEYGFPESHAASFALLAYVTSWLRCHHPAAFACALLNSMPMGFYSAATLVEDARRNGVDVLPIDVLSSTYDHCLVRDALDSGVGAGAGGGAEAGAGAGAGAVAEAGAGAEAGAAAGSDAASGSASASASGSGSASASGSASGAPEGTGKGKGTGKGAPPLAALRMGMRLVKGLSESDAHSIETLRRSGRLTSLERLVRETTLSERALVSLAEAGALERLTRSRRDALWQIRALTRARQDGIAAAAPRTQLSFDALTEDEAVLWDYRASKHSARGHPIARFRSELHARGMPSAVDLERNLHGDVVKYVGLVICRQRPMTASGVTFMTLEDETGFANLVFWARQFEQDSVLLKTAVVLGVTAEVQKADGVTHLIVQRAWRPPPELQPKTQELNHQSRDFH